MADNTVSSAIGILVQLLVDEAKVLKNVHKEAASIKAESETIKSFLKDADSRAEAGNEMAKIWVKKVRELAYEIKDVIHEYILYLGEQRRRRGRVDDPRIASLFIEDDEVVGIESTLEALIHSLITGESNRTISSLVRIGGCVTKRLLACVKLGLQKLKREHGRALCGTIEKMKHLQEVLIVHAMTQDEILDLQSLSSLPACLPQLRLAGHLEKLPDWIPKLENPIHPSLGSDIEQWKVEVGNLEGFRSVSCSPSNP
ncbi:hypothetical protein Acr_02g0008690 [Actinidia rufa]|uniref:Disease resistance N-terminal domain-containing protein n=1 Tax=Actinidia rufa TaxID=165716 RepID=A0A7J0E9P0_9ERIC|nr:hypothetical protein Acr_02g0008690 [Actinidia rufa]